jgi:hypothetical protein
VGPGKSANVLVGRTRGGDRSKRSQGSNHDGSGREAEVTKAPKGRPTKLDHDHQGNQREELNLRTPTYTCH